MKKRKNKPWAWRIGNAAAGCRPAAPGWGESGEGAVSLRDTWPPAGSPATAPGGFGGGLGGRDRDGGGEPVRDFMRLLFSLQRGWLGAERVD